MKTLNLRQKAVASLIAITCAVAVLGGCKSPEAAIVGKWKSSAGPDITMKEDKTFSQGSGAQSATGTWSVADKTVTISILTIGGKSTDEVIDAYAKMAGGALKPDLVAKAKAQAKAAAFDISADGKTLTSREAGFTGQKVTLTKSDN
jgi:hypothetical protein